eukprot:2327924-Pleurochrysis_carterae.AAC.4
MVVHIRLSDHVSHAVSECVWHNSDESTISSVFELAGCIVALRTLAVRHGCFVSAVVSTRRRRSLACERSEQARVSRSLWGRDSGGCACSCANMCVDVLTYTALSGSLSLSPATYFAPWLPLCPLSSLYPLPPSRLLFPFAYPPACCLVCVSARVDIFQLHLQTLDPTLGRCARIARGTGLRELWVQLMPTVQQEDVY